MKFHLLFLAGILVLLSCRKDPNFNKLNTNLLVQTGVDTTAKFNTYKTFAISDTINFVSNLTSVNYWSDSNSNKLLSQIRTTMANRHFTRVNKTDKPDLAVNVTFINNVQQSIYYDPYWWDNSFYGSMYWGYNYPYYGYATVSTINNTGLVIELVDLKNAQANQKLNVIWSAAMSGNINKSASENIAMILRAINTAFTQSPYLQTN